MLGLLTITSVFRNWRNSLQRKVENDNETANEYATRVNAQKSYKLDEPPISA
ncbi:hypothetical protein LOAG_14438 [Loa loa]|uniref:Uncharacterized protein n=1 Tax=Loa loa TaxID=7209 RepID=A0A1I7W006_LOALO|nr:hypothetical protein LOAG_14438 [Loa loa]EFO14086.2 hypothetical protein LOAG_14438 [Loa loa]